jgi:uncharacterized protein (TIGR03118 family)
MDLKAMGNLRAVIAAAIVVCAGGKVAMAQAYQQTNLVSDIQGLAQNPPTGQADTQLLNPWGLVSSSTSAWWISDNNAGLSTLYTGQGVKQGLVVNIPSPTSATGGTPTGVVFTGASGFSFQADGKTTGAVFTFVTEDGTIVAWGSGINPQDLHTGSTAKRCLPSMSTKPMRASSRRASASDNHRFAYTAIPLVS